MPCRLLSTLLLAFAAGGSLASAATAQEVVFLAFGDSITEGYGDTSALGGGLHEPPPALAPPGGL